jgi:hypothetical protein
MADLEKQALNTLRALQSAINLSGDDQVKTTTKLIFETLRAEIQSLAAQCQSSNDPFQTSAQPPDDKEFAFLQIKKSYSEVEPEEPYLYITSKIKSFELQEKLGLETKWELARVYPLSTVKLT